MIYMSTDIYCRIGGYVNVPGPPIADPNQGKPLEGMRSMQGNQSYGGPSPPAVNQFNQPPYQPPPINQHAGGFQVILMHTVYQESFAKDNFCNMSNVTVFARKRLQI